MIDILKLKALLQIDITDTADDFLLNIIITATEEFVKSYCTREFEYKDYTEQHKINHHIFVKNYPIDKVEYIKFISVSDKSLFYIKDLIGEDITHLFINRGKYLQYVNVNTEIDIQNNTLDYGNNTESIVEIKYGGGYSELPVDLEFACFEIACMKYKQFKEDRSGKSNLKVGNLSETYTDELSMTTLKTLNKYKRKSL